MRSYGEDLAWVHDAGFSGFCLSAAPGLLRILRRHGVTSGLVADLGCGSGRWARELNRGGYDVLGVDQSPAFLRLARRLAPRSRFVAGSLWTIELPPCDAITSIGECLNYGVDRTAGRAAMARLFARLHAALRPGGVFLFDVAGPSRVPANSPRRHWTEGRDWAILVESEGDRKRNTLTRRIVCFRKVGTRYRRSEEVHRLRLYQPERVLAELRRAGFHAERLPGYGRFRLPEGITAFLALKRGSKAI